MLVAMGMVACMPGDDNAPVEPNLRTLQQHELRTVDASTAFAMDLYQQLRKADSPNQFFSPYSIHVALSMAMAGNEGEALEEYLDVLRFDDQTVEEANKGAKDLTDFLLQVDPKVKTHIANGMWYRQDYLVKAAFRQVLEDYYNAEVAGIDVFDPKSADIINGWIERNTEGLIKDMLDQIPPDAVMYLVNAIYYKADWKYQFDASKTKKEPFYVNQNKQVQVDMMSLGDETGTMKLYTGGTYHYVEIPYSTGQYSMGVVLPNGYDIERIEEEITVENLALWRNQARETNLLLKLPKFKLKEKRENMAEDLMEMGLRIPFAVDARNFSLLFDNPTDPLSISRLIHDAVIEVDEKGSEAAAVTVVEVEATSAGPSTPRVFAVDRPFIFFIQEKHSGAVLFMGKLGDPSLL